VGKRGANGVGPLRTPIEAYIEFGTAELPQPEEEREPDEVLQRLVLRVHRDDIELIKEFAARLAEMRQRS
jgi:hypothetical protein